MVSHGARRRAFTLLAHAMPPCPAPRAPCPPPFPQAGLLCPECSCPAAETNSVCAS